MNFLAYIKNLFKDINVNKINIEQDFDKINFIELEKLDWTSNGRWFTDDDWSSSMHYENNGDDTGDSYWNIIDYVLRKDPNASGQVQDPTSELYLGTNILYREGEIYLTDCYVDDPSTLYLNGSVTIFSPYKDSTDGQGRYYLNTIYKFGELPLQ